MDRWKLRVKHNQVIFKRELINVLDVLHLKDALRKRLESNTPVFKESVDIDITKKSIFVLPNIPWSYRWQRPQQIFSRLGLRGFNIFYVSPITSNVEYISCVSKGVYEVHVKTFEFGNVLRDFHLKSDNVNEFLDSFHRLVDSYLKNDSILFVLHPVWKDVAFGLKDIKKVYDLMDLYEGFADARKELVEGERELILKSDLVLATADSLYEYGKKLNKNIHLVKNGCDYEYFSNVSKNGVLDGLSGRAVIGYFGAISSWLDVELLEYVVRENMDKDFVFLGSINTKNVRRLYHLKNVFFLGEVEYMSLAGYLGYFDVCIIPFVLNDLIKNTNPVKFYEYISSGKPVVSVRLPELEQYSDICYLANTKEEFSKYVCDALEEEKSLVEKRKKVAEENSWEERVKETLKLINM